MGLWNFLTTKGSGINDLGLLKNFLLGKQFNLATTGALALTKLVEPMPNNALSISEALLERRSLLYPFVIMGVLIPTQGKALSFEIHLYL